MAININRENTDMFYRYKMPPLAAKVEGKGNGIKTVIVNAEGIGKALERPATYVCKFFGCELGAQTQMDIKNSRYIVNGAHEQDRLQDLLDVFIRKFVLCPECENPETKLTVSPSKTKIAQDCAACGYHGQLDMRHKLTTYIVNNPPGQVPGTAAAKKGGKKGKKGQQQRKGRDSPPTSGSPPNSSGADKGRFSYEEAALEPTNSTNGAEDSEDIDEEWSVDTSENAVKARMEKMSNGVASLAMNSDLEKTTSERVDLFYKYTKDIITSGGIAQLAKDFAAVKAEAERLDVADAAAAILAELLFDKNIITQIATYRPIFIQFIFNKTKAQKHLLDAVEGMVANDNPELLPKMPHILKSLYDSDLVEEEAVYEWHAKMPKKQMVPAEAAAKVRQLTKPVIEWLKNAEEESSSDEDDVQVVYSDKQKPGLVASEKKPEEQDQKNADDDDDLDIDDI